MSSAYRHEAARIFAASAASRARSSALPRVPISPWVRSRIPVRYPSCAIFSRVPPQVCSTSSRCAARARMSSGGVDMSVETALFQNHVLPNDQAMRRHFFQGGQDPADVLIGIDEDDDHRQFATGIHQMAGLDLLAAKKSRYRMERGRRVDIFLAQVVENFHVQRTMMPLVSFVK